MQGNKRQKIILVDDNKASLTMGKNILSEYYDVYTLSSAVMLFECLKCVTPDLILLDIDMPDMSGYGAMALLKADRQYVDIPVIFVTARTSELNKSEGLALGAVDYVGKPFAPALLLKRIENHLLFQRQKAELQDFNDNVCTMMKDITQQICDLQNAVVSHHLWR